METNPCQRCCANCRFAVHLEHKGEPLLACASRDRGKGRFIVVEPDDECRSFMPRVQPKPESADEGTALIPLVNVDGLYTQVDPADYEWLSRYTWFATCGTGALYACTYIKSKRCFMHRLLMNPPKGMFVDHKNRNSLDNHRVNLRNCTRQQNQANRWRPPGVSRFTGVKPYGNKWQAWIGCCGKVIPLGLFDDPAEAARVRDHKARELHGDFACLNFPNEGRIVGLRGAVRIRCRVGDCPLQVSHRSRRNAGTPGLKGGCCLAISASVRVCVNRYCLRQSEERSRWVIGVFRSDRPVAPCLSLGFRRPGLSAPDFVLLARPPNGERPNIHSLPVLERRQ